MAGLEYQAVIERLKSHDDQFQVGNQMSALLWVIGVACWLFAGLALVVSLGTDGATDIQLIAAAVWGTFGAVCVGSAALIAEVRRLRTAVLGVPKISR